MTKRPDDDPRIWDGDTCMICCLDAIDVQTGMDQGVCTPRTRVVNMAKHRYDVYIGRGRGSISPPGSVTTATSGWLGCWLRRMIMPITPITTKANKPNIKN